VSQSLTAGKLSTALKKVKAKDNRSIEKELELEKEFPRRL